MSVYAPTLSARGVNVTLPAHIPEKCIAACEYYKKTVSECETATAECMCTLVIEHGSYSCSSCTATKKTYAALQSQFDNYVAECTNRGYPLPKMSFPSPSNTTSSSSSTVAAGPTANVVASAGATLTVSAKRTTTTTTTSASASSTQLVFHNSASQTRGIGRAAIMTVGVLALSLLL
ncbi:hypothetical protein EXIGLDRAFT_762646 [Exidia glandulosa HHB12029]|uniref:Uncharacterized protein n=1 Tax=Exidia glandulosa HHB12029 TaxID=1314781 RepID=A0A165MJ79_EXIGL|nr:hypothetical protein EXIGLDRAFT_762646 [Exidia glandulosa HHB12029]